MRMWMDCFCIDQREKDDITIHVKCLPLFLMACETTLVLFSATYVTRLWCLAEVYSAWALGQQRLTVPNDEDGQDTTNISCRQHQSFEIIAALKSDGNSSTSGSSGNFANVSIFAANATVPEDKTALLERLAECPGGIDGADKTIREALREAILQRNLEEKLSRNVMAD